MGVYLVDHPPRTQQFRCPRRERPSGVIGVHTAESFPDETGPDTGAENVARFIRDRSNYGSYHLLADSDSVIQLIEFRCVAYHIATHGLNEHSIGVSAATQAHRWGGLDDFWVKACVTNMARASVMAATWLQREHGITVPARRISLAQARNKVPGFIAHADADPDRRTDPGTSFPWEMYLDTYAAIMAGEEDDMPYSDWPKADRDALAADVARAVQSRSVQVGFDVEPLGLAVGRTRAVTRRVEPDVAKIQETVTALLASGAGESSEQVIARIDAHHAEVLTRFEHAELERREIAVLVEQALSGERDVTEVLRMLAGILTDATAEPAEP